MRHHTNTLSGAKDSHDSTVIHIYFAAPCSSVQRIWSFTLEYGIHSRKFRLNTMAGFHVSEHANSGVDV